MLESTLNTLSGLILALILWYVIRYSGQYEIHTTAVEGLEITLLFTIVSIIRSFAWRRIFNRLHEFLERWVK